MLIGLCPSTAAVAESTAPTVSAATSAAVFHVFNQVIQKSLRKRVLDEETDEKTG